MKYLLIRHCESTKSISEKFRTTEDHLTQNGVLHANCIASCIKSYVDKYNIEIKRIYSSSMSRAKETANIIARKCSVEVKEIIELRSMEYMKKEDITEKELKTMDNSFHHQLSLYRNGIFNAYSFQYSSYVESQISFEKRIKKALEYIDSYDKNEELKIIIAHHSSITALIIHFARLFYNYPMGFYGNVSIDLGGIYMIDERRFNIINGNASELL